MPSEAGLPRLTSAALVVGAAALMSGCVKTVEPNASNTTNDPKPAASASVSAPKTVAQPPVELPAWAKADPFANLPPAQGATLRVGGDQNIKAEPRGENWASGTCLIDTPLPDGYPAPTPPGAIELKRYPLVRRAEVRGESSPDFATNIGFFPLFNHIKRRDIAMTSPVEVDYRELRTEYPADEPPRGTAWNMAFLYRKVDQGPAGADPKNKNVMVRDLEPITVLAIGLKGPYSMGAIADGATELEKWLASNPEWEAIGSDARGLYYNGPNRRDRDKWAEAQIQVRYVGVKPAKTQTKAGAKN